MSEEQAAYVTENRSDGRRHILSLMAPSLPVVALYDFTGDRGFEDVHAWALTELWDEVKERHYERVYALVVQEDGQLVFADQVEGFVRLSDDAEDMQAFLQGLRDEQDS